MQHSANAQGHSYASTFDDLKSPDEIRVWEYKFFLIQMMLAFNGKPKKEMWSKLTAAVVFQVNSTADSIFHLSSQKYFMKPSKHNDALIQWHHTTKETVFSRLGLFPSRPNLKYLLR